MKEMIWKLPILRSLEPLTTLTAVELMGQPLFIIKD